MGEAHNGARGNEIRLANIAEIRRMNALGLLLTDAGFLLAKVYRMNPIGLLLVAAGVFSICGAAFDWDWFINSRKARFFVAVFGRTGARIFYALLGIAIAVAGVLIALGILKDAS